jgi:murein DD-endopeptidase MepM/ murein hydrolase activator NlpD
MKKRLFATPVAAQTRYKRWFLVLASLPLFAVMAAFGIAPDTATNTVEQDTVVEAIDLPEPQSADNGSFDFWREERVQRGDTLASLLRRLGVNDEEAVLVRAAGRDSDALGRLSQGRNVLARVTSTGRLVLLRYMASDERLITVERVRDDFRVQDQTIQPETELVMRSGEIRGSLYGATDAADIPDAIASKMAEVFSGAIDFHRDLRRGDRFSVVYEADYHEGRILKTGRLLAAEFVNGGETHQAVLFTDTQGREAYYTPEGRSMKRAFLKSPMPFTRISSGFSSARYHPVLKEWRAHKGIDYAAPTGTPIRAIADGVVDFSGRKGGYGNLIVLNHQRPYSSAYGHLSAYAKGVRRGARVEQGQVIGYVGATGLATGPHLHYEFRVNGQQRNPLALNLPTTYPLEGRDRARFFQHAAPLTQRLDLLHGHNITALN